MVKLNTDSGLSKASEIHLSLLVPKHVAMLQICFPEILSALCTGHICLLSQLQKLVWTLILTSHKSVQHIQLPQNDNNQWRLKNFIKGYTQCVSGYTDKANKELEKTSSDQIKFLMINLVDLYKWYPPSHWKLCRAKTRCIRVQNWKI